MTQNDILDLMVFDSEEERKTAIKYITLKGIVQHKRLIDCCVELGDKKPNYKKISSLYKYDKRLRDQQYIYIATVEEYIHATIGNRFEDNKDGLICTFKLTEKMKKTKSLSLALEQLMLSELKDVVLKNQELFTDEYTINEHFKQNLKALKTFRNKVVHHNFLFSGNFDKCIINGDESDTLTANIKNLQQFLPKDFRAMFAYSINNCNNNLQLPEEFIVCI